MLYFFLSKCENTLVSYFGVHRLWSQMWSHTLTITMKFDSLMKFDKVPLILITNMSNLHFVTNKNRLQISAATTMLTN